MIRPRGPFSSAPSKASPQTLCQKCLKRGHYSYECKSSTQERPYASRPSRTQQLSNPKLLPKLTSDTPNELLRKKGVADEELAKKEAERGRKRKLEDDGYGSEPDKRSRSVLSYSSVTTISTNNSRSLSPDTRGQGYTGQSQSMAGLEMTGRQRRSPSSSMSYDSDSGTRKGLYKPKPPALREQNGNQRRSPHRARRSTSASYTSSSSNNKPRRGHAPSRDGGGKGEGGGKRRRRASRSPEDRGRERESAGPRKSSRREYSPSLSRDRSEVTRHRKSMTPGVPSKFSDSGPRPPEPSSYGRGGGRRKTSYEDDHDRYGGSLRVGREEGGRENNRPPPSRRNKERSLSPFSKRLALTQAMNTGR